jgi:hypothetical protein
MTDTKRVPREPTAEMVKAGLARHWPQSMSGGRLTLLWQAMYDAAPALDSQSEDVPTRVASYKGPRVVPAREKEE